MRSERLVVLVGEQCVRVVQVLLRIRREGSGPPVLVLSEHVR